MQRRAMANTDACRSNHRGKRGHGRHCSNAKCGDVADRSAARRQGEGRKDAEKMRAARDPVQNPHAERRVRVSEAARPCGTRVDVHVVVLDSAVVMSTARDVQCATQRPQADSDERNADNSFAPRRENVDRRQQIAQDDGEQCHDNDARRVTTPPGPPCKPTTPAILDREWSDGREVVWSREDVK